LTAAEIREKDSFGCRLGRNYSCAPDGTKSDQASTSQRKAGGKHIFEFDLSKGAWIDRLVYEEHESDIGTIFNILTNSSSLTCISRYGDLAIAPQAAGRCLPRAKGRANKPGNWRRAVEYIRQHADRR